MPSAWHGCVATPFIRRLIVNDNINDNISSESDRDLLDFWSKCLYNGSSSWDYCLSFRDWCMSDWQNWKRFKRIANEIDKHYHVWKKAHRG